MLEIELTGDQGFLDDITNNDVISTFDLKNVHRVRTAGGRRKLPACFCLIHKTPTVTRNI